MIKILNFFKIKLGNSPFIKNTLIVTFGTGIAQLVPMISYPFLARIFSPSEFGLLAIITSLVPIIAVISSGAYEGGILLSKSKRASINLSAYILIRSFIILSFFTLLIILFNKNISEILNEPLLTTWIFSVPIISLGAVIFNISNEWNVKYKYFSALSFNKAFYTVTNVIFKLIVGLFSAIKFGGLILGDLFGKLFMIFYCFFMLRSLDGNSFKSINFKDIRQSPKLVYDFPKFVMPDQIISNLGGSIHIFFISSYFGSAQVGLVSIVSSLLYAPITIFSSAIKDVFRQRAIEEFEVSKNCRPLYFKLLIPIVAIATIGFSFLYLILPSFFRIFFGQEWEDAGKYGQILIPLFCLSFISMSLKDVFVVVKKMHIALIWQVFYIVILVCSLIVGTMYFSNLNVTLHLMTLAGSISHILYMALSYYYAKE